MVTEYVYSFHKENKAVKTIESGETITLKTLDCFSNQVRDESQLITSIDFNRVNPATGPIKINNSKKGDILKVEIIDITIEDTGFISTLPETGPLFSKEKILRTKKIKVEDGYVLFNDIKFKANPMIGVIGVAPEKDKIACGFPGSHGGNMDCKKIIKGTTLYFPINVDGALFQLGDLHASMGDGEICGAGIEIPGEVTVKLSVIKDKKLRWPILETDSHYYAIASDEKFEKALEYSSSQIQDLIASSYKWDLTDIYLYLSAIGDFEICQGCKPSPFPTVVRFGVPKIEEKEELI